MANITGRRMMAEIDGDFVVFLIGARFNSFQLLKTVLDLGGRRGMKHMLDYLVAHPEKGLLGYQMGLPTIGQYWRSFDHLEAFANDTGDPHVAVWRNYWRRDGTSTRTGIWHETYLVRAGEFDLGGRSWQPLWMAVDPDGPDAPPDQLRPARNLLDVYDDRSFRFCFSNRQMAEAVLDFVWDRPELRPKLFADVAPLAVLPALGVGVSRLELFLAWVLGGMGTVTFGLWQLRKSCGGYLYRPRLVRSLVPAMVTTGIGNHTLTLSERVPGLVLPIVVTELLSPQANAFWYVIWMSAWVVFITPLSVGIALFAEGSHRPQAMSGATAQALRISLIFGGGGAALLWLLATPVLDLLGHEYAKVGTTPLRILLLAVIPMAFTSAYYARCRTQGRLGEAIATGILGGVAAVVVTAIAGVEHGLSGMAIAWVGIQTVISGWAGMRLWAARW